MVCRGSRRSGGPGGGVDDGVLGCGEGGKDGGEEGVCEVGMVRYAG